MFELVLIITIVVISAAAWIMIKGEDASELIKGEVQEVIEEVKEAVEDVFVDEKTLGKMTKAELEEYARERGVELDKRKTKANMIQDFLGAKTNLK